MVVALRAEVQITAQNQLRPGLARAAAALEKFRQQESKVARQTAQMERMERAAGVARAAMAGIAPAVGLASLATANKRFAEVDRSMTRIGITGDATAAQVTDGTSQLRNIAHEVALPFDEVRAGLDQITASGRDFGDAMKMMPAVARTAQASGAQVSDIANSSTALIDHMKISIEGLQLAQDTLAKGGKLGKFELKDMARYLPSILPSLRALGYQGQEGLERAVATLQTIRMGTGTAEEAAASANNIFSKMESEATVKNFKDMGVDLPKALAKARKEGKDLLEVFTDLSRQALKGDMSKLPQLFQDMEFARGMRAMLDFQNKRREFLAELRNSGGTIATDLKRLSNDSQTALDRMGNAADRAGTAVGAFATQLATPALNTAAGNLNDIADAMERLAKLQKERGLLGAVRELARNPEGSDIGPHNIPFFNELPHPGKRVREIKQARDAKQLRDDTDAKIADLDRRIAAERQRVNNLAPSFRAAATQGRVAPLEAERTRVTEARREYEQAQLDIVEHQRRHGGKTPTFMQPALKDGQPITPGLRTFGFGQFGTTNYMMPDPPSPPRRPDDLAVKPPAPVLKSVADIQGMDEARKPVAVHLSDLTGGFDAAAAKAGTLKSTVVEIGPAAEIAGSRIAAGVTSGLSQADAQVDAFIARTRQKLAAANFSVSIGGIGGLNTGRSMNESR